MVKKIILVLLSFVVLCSFASCGNKIKNEESVFIKENENKNAYTLNATPLSREITFDGNGVAVTLNEIIYEDVITKLSFDIKNNTEQMLKVLITDISVNEIMCVDTMMTDVEANSEKTDYFEISNEWFYNLDIETIMELEFVVRILDGNSNEIAHSDTLRATTDAPITYSQQYNLDGTEIYDKDGITFSVGELKSSKYSNDYELVFNIFNNTKRSFSVMAKDVYVNDVKVNPTFIITVGANKSAVDTMLFLENDLKSLKINEIKTVTASFIAKDENSNTVFELLNVNIPFK